MLFFILFFLLLFSNIRSHILIIPYPFYNREYSIKQTKYILSNEFFIDSKINKKVCKKWEFVFNGIVFYRIAERAYDVLSDNRYLSAAFHGLSEFDLSDLSPNSKILYIKNNNNYKNILKDNEYIRYEGLVRPMYRLEEQGVNFAIDIVRKISDYTTFLCQLRLPVINKSVYHDQNWNDVKYDSDCINDDRLYIDSLNKYFKVRVDYLFEKKIIPEVRSINDIKQFRGAVFLFNDFQNYFLEKPIGSQIIYPNEDFLLNNESDEEIDNVNLDVDNNKSINKNIIEKCYAATEFNEMILPTDNSLLLYKKLIESKDFFSSNILNEISKGVFLDKNYDWNSVNFLYIAPLDIQFNISKIFDNENIILQGLLAFVIPMKNSFYKKDNYLIRSFFQDQYAFRLGSQMTYDINRFYKILFYGSWQYYLPCNQIIPAIFENITAYGLSPLYLNGIVSWYELYFSSHLIMKYNENFGLDLGYQYIYKSGDNVIPECENFYLINGDKYKLDYTIWKKFSSSIANLLLLNFYYYFGQLQFDLGIRGLMSGRNIIKIQEYSLRVGMDF